MIAELKRIREQDKRYDDGKILCSMCTKPLPIAEKAYWLFLSSNLGDPGLFPGSVQLEKELITQLTTLLHGENCVGYLVSGGTEANLMALLAARNMAQVSQPEVVLPESAHFSFSLAGARGRSRPPADCVAGFSLFQLHVFFGLYRQRPARY